NSRITLAGPLSSVGGTTDVRFAGTTSDTSGFNLTAANPLLTGTIYVRGGVLGIAADSSLGNAANPVIMQNLFNTPTLEFLSHGTTLAHSLQLDAPSRIIASGTNSNTIASAITGAGSLT